MSQQQSKRLGSRGWCQFAVIGCVAVAIAAIGVCVAMYMYIHGKPATTGGGPTPATPIAVTRTASVTTAATPPLATLSPTPSEQATPPAFVAEWTGTLKRGSERTVPVKVDPQGTCYVAALD